MKTSNIIVNNRNAIDLLPFCYYFSNLSNYSVGKYLVYGSATNNYGRHVFVGIAQKDYIYPAIIFRGNSYIYVVTYTKNENSNTLELKHSSKIYKNEGVFKLDFTIDKGDYIGFVIDSNLCSVYFQQ